jgi:DNA-binding protein HU-beta
MIVVRDYETTGVTFLLICDQKSPFFNTFAIKMAPVAGNTPSPFQRRVRSRPVNKAELVDAIVAESGAAKNTVAEVLKAFEDVVVKNVSGGEKIVLSGFLSFERVERKARTARNPQTGEAIQVKASRAPKVSIGSTFKKAVKGM